MQIRGGEPRARLLAGRHRLLRRLGEDDRVFERFIREAEIIATLAHPNIAAALDFGTTEPRAYLAMEYVAGTTLQRSLVDRSKRREPLSTEELLDAIGALAAALDHAHAHGVVHGDLKPLNVLVPARGSWRDLKIVDFKVAKVLATSDDDRATTEGRTPGSVLYMAPEQFENENVGPRADIYSLGCIAFELMTFCFAWARDEKNRYLNIDHRSPDGSERNAPVPTWTRTRVAPRPRVSSIRPDLPVELDDVIARALAVSPEDRFASARELEHAIEDAFFKASFSVSLEKAIETLEQASRAHAVARETPPPSPPAAVPEEEEEPRWRYLIVLALLTATVFLVTMAIGRIVLRPPVVQAVLIEGAR